MCKICVSLCDCYVIERVKMFVIYVEFTCFYVIGFFWVVKKWLICRVLVVFFVFGSVLGKFACGFCLVFLNMLNIFGV